MKKLFLLILSFGLVAGGAAYVYFSPDQASQANRPVPPQAHEMRTPQPTSTLPKRVRYVGDRDTILKKKLHDTLGRAASYKVTFKGNAAPWMLVYGQPLETNGTQFNYADSRVKQQFFDRALENQFCALLHTDSEGYEIIAFDLGSLDSPVSYWQEKFDLPKSLFE